jgi:cytochrome c553
MVALEFTGRWCHVESTRLPDKQCEPVAEPRNPDPDRLRERALALARSRTFFYKNPTDIMMTPRDNNITLQRSRGFTRLVIRGVVLVVAVLALLVTAIWVRGERIIGRKYQVPVHAPLAIETDSATIQRGRHIARAIGSCTLCHGEDLGGAVYMDAGPMGFVAGPNLTAGEGGIASRLTVDDWVRAIRYGVRRDSTSLLIMPSEVFVHLSDRDLAALIAYLTGLPPVDRALAETEFRWLGKLLTGAGRLNLLVASKTEPFISVPHIEPGVTVEYGRYLVETAGCAGCHGYGLSGGRVAGPPDLPPASNLTPAGQISTWTESEFIRSMREGVRPDGTVMDDFMPWRILGRMTDDEMRAIWLYLGTVPAKTFGHK